MLKLHLIIFNTGVATPQLQWIVFSGGFMRKQVSTERLKNSAAECLVKRLLLNSKSLWRTLKLKEEVWYGWSSRCCRCCYRNVRIYRQRDMTRLPLLKKEKKGVLMSSNFKRCWYRGSFRTTIMPGLNRNRRRSRSAVVGILDHLSKKMKKKPEHLLVNKIE
jgi:hypothetical protein